MNLQSILYASIFIISYCKVYTEKNPELVIARSLVRPCGIGLEFVVELNNTSDGVDCEVQVSGDECCLEVDDGLDCNVLDILGEAVEFVPNGSIKTVRMVAPIIDPTDRRGYCVLYFDSKCTNNDRNKRDIVKVNFDTKIENIKKILEVNIKKCKNIDEDPWNDCKPVDCDSYYNNRKPYYSKRLKRCIETPPCSSDAISELPNVIYDPISNSCIEGKSISKRDVDYIKNLNVKDRQAKDVVIIKMSKNITDDVDTSEDLNDAIDKVPMCKKCNKLHILNPDSQEWHEDKSHIDRSFVSHTTEKYYTMKLMQYLKSNKYTLIVFGGLILVQCCIIVAMIYCFTKSCSRCKDKKVVRKFFNYRQDASVTTPLIGTSNMDTETDYQFETESSNVDKKIKSYKACQNQKNNNVKMSLSDDILSKCLNRRNWSRQQNIPEANEAQVDIDNVEVNRVEPVVEPKKPSETKVVFEDEKRKSTERASKKIGSIPKCLNKEIIDREKEDIEEYKSSELEIQCHNYNNDIHSNITGFKPCSTTKNLEYCTADKKPSIGGSTEKCAQVNFSNDFLDDLICERVREHYFADDLSRYTINSTESDPTKTSTPTPVSSKTSKNRVRSFLARLGRKPRTNASSDPGANGEPNRDIQVIHMSEQSIYSTSNDYECIKCIKPTNSRTSM